MEPSSLQKKMLDTISSNCLSVRLRLLNRKIGAIFDAKLRPHGIKSSQLNILVAVSAFEKVTSHQLCRMLNMDTSTLSRAVAILKKNQWLQVEPSGEGKILKIGITAKGLKKVEQAYPDWQKAQEEAKKILGESTADRVIESGNEHLLEGMTHS